jgi:predicted AlkP superfamily phosphohydrolase/phosphomutase
LFLFVEMGTDRIHHGFWSMMDPQHFRYAAGNPFEHAIHDYYVYLDTEIGTLLDKVGDDTVVVVVSDHGAQRMDGGFCVNEWLQDKRLLTVASKPPGIVPLHQCQVDWAHTVAWGDGGYYARIFLNVEGREPQGVIPAADYEAVRDQLKAALEATTGPDGNLLGTIVLKPEEVYREVKGIAPDLIVYFGGLYWRSVGSIGHGGWYTYENDTGPDDANHAQDGLVILYDPQAPLPGYQLSGLQLEAIGPTLLHLLDVEVPDSMMGQPIQLPVLDDLALGVNGLNGHVDHNGVTDTTGYTDEEEDAITKHLAALGYAV